MAMGKMNDLTYLLAETLRPIILVRVEKDQNFADIPIIACQDTHANQRSQGMAPGIFCDWETQ